MNYQEIDAVRARYARRKTAAQADRYSLLRPEVWQAVQERQRVMLRLFARHGIGNLAETRLTEVGCGNGGNLLEFLRLGFRPDHIVGIELLPERIAVAREVLPQGLTLHEGDATAAPIETASQDMVFQSVVFSSLLDAAFQTELATTMWRWVKPGGGVLWYDFVYDNPANLDVRGVPVRRIRELFPDGRLTIRRVTLAPPISRRVCRLHPHAYYLFNAIPWLRTHVLCWIGKR